MILFGKDLDREVVVVAEIGVNHEGDVDTALRLVELAARAGADAVKLQSYTPSRFISACDAERWRRVSAFALDENAHECLATAAHEVGVQIFSTAISEDLVPLLDRLFPAIKIASGDLTFEPVIRAAASTGKPVIISTGLGTVDEIDRAVDWVRSEVGEETLHDRLILMHCISAYPTPIEEANLLSVPFLAERYGIPVGYSNHVVGVEACLGAVALGASVVEVHFTDRREGRTFRDHALSIEPQELAALVAATARMRAARGSYGKIRQDCELPNLEAIRKGIVAARDLVADTILTRADLMFARPATEFSAADRDTLLGQRVGRAIASGELIRRDDLCA